MTIGDKILRRHLTDLERADRAEAEAFRPGFARRGLPKDRKSQGALALAICATFVGGSLSLVGSYVGFGLFIVGFRRRLPSACGASDTGTTKSGQGESTVRASVTHVRGPIVLTRNGRRYVKMLLLLFAGRPGEAVLPDMTDQDDRTLIKKDGALAGAAVSAAIGVAVYGLRKALSDGSGGLPLGQGRDHDEDDERAGHLRPRNDSLLVSAWDSASHALVPLAESAAEAAGKWVARNSPDLVRERLMPRFIESFTDAA